jgi:hypothetical protein
MNCPPLTAPFTIRDQRGEIPPTIIDHHDLPRISEALEKYERRGTIWDSNGNQCRFVGRLYTPSYKLKAYVKKPKTRHDRIVEVLRYYADYRIYEGDNLPPVPGLPWVIHPVTGKMLCIKRDGGETARRMLSQMNLRTQNKHT